MREKVSYYTVTGQLLPTPSLLPLHHSCLDHLGFQAGICAGVLEQGRLYCSGGQTTCIRAEA